MEKHENWFVRHQGWSVSGTIVGIIAATVTVTIWVYEETRVHNLKSEHSRQLASLTGSCDSVGLAPSEDQQNATLLSCRADNSDLSLRLKQLRKKEQAANTEIASLKVENNRLAKISSSTGECRARLTSLTRETARLEAQLDEEALGSDCAYDDVSKNNADRSFEITEGKAYVDHKSSLVVAVTSVGYSIASLKLTRPGGITETLPGVSVGDTWSFSADKRRYELILISLDREKDTCSFLIREQAIR